MNTDEAITSIEACTTPQQLISLMHKIAGDYGFAAINFIDAGQPGVDEPYNACTTSLDWVEDYRNNGFIHVDHIIPIVRKGNLPFRWSEIKLPQRLGKRKPKSHQLMEAAQDHGFEDGFVVPFHFFDHMGRHNIASCVYFWKDKISKLGFMLKNSKHDIHIITIYFAQKLSDLAAHEMKTRAKFLDSDGSPLNSVHLTERERESLLWAAQGKTTEEAALIMNIKANTVKEYLETAKRKLGARTKTHAASMALYMGLIDL
jgi:LuxR family quorum sensing-dependent transcriptional regulator